MTNLETIRRNRNLQQQDVADAAGVPQATISRIERGKGATLKSAMRIARALNLSVEEVFGDVAESEGDDEPEAAGNEPVYSDPPSVIEPGPDPYAAAKAKLAVEDAKRAETVVKAMLARQADELAEAERKRVA